MEKKLKINVLIATYCQEDVIKRAIDSSLSQGEEYLNKIIISDDCSADNTWDVISDYASRYPNLIMPYRNEKNLGIYGNFNSLLNLKGKADLYYFLSGDDVISEGWFKAVSDYIFEKNISISEAVGIFGDFKVVMPNGEEQLSKVNSSVLGNQCLFSLHIRGLVSSRSLLVTESVLAKCTPVDTTRGVGYAESLFNNQQFEAIDKAYYLPCLGNVYYAGIGVSKNILDYDPEYFTNNEILKYYLESSAKTSADKHFIKSKIDAICFIEKFNILKLIWSIYNYIKGMNGYNFSKSQFLCHYKMIIMVALVKLKNRIYGIFRTI